MPTNAMATRRKSRGPPDSWMPLAGDVVLLGAVLNLCYASVLIYALANPEGRLGLWVASWVRAAAPILKPAYLLAGPAPCGGARVTASVVRAWSFDVHLTALNLIVAAALFVASRRYWAGWLQALHAEPGAGIAARRRDADAGSGVMLWGGIAALWWLVLENDLFDSAAHCASMKPWLLLRAPLLTTAAHACASFAAAFWTARTPEPGD